MAIVNLIKPDDMKGNFELVLGNFDDPESLLFDKLVAQNQVDYLEKLLGYQLVSELDTDMNDTEDPTDQKWVKFLDGVVYDEIGINNAAAKVNYKGFRNILKHFIYYSYKRESANDESLQGTFVQERENSDVVSSDVKAWTNYNSGVKLYGNDWDDLFINYNEGRLNQYGVLYKKTSSRSASADRNRLAPTAYNFIRKNTVIFPNWIFTELKYMPLTG